MSPTSQFAKGLAKPHRAAEANCVGALGCCSLQDLEAEPLVVDPLLRSGLALAGANLPSASGEDGILTAVEVSGLHLWGTKLVVLSACETAKGKVYKAEGIIGFTRAFMMAGAPRVIVSLWKVDDAATKALMVKFYEVWKTEPAATALKRAQEFVSSHEKWRHPYYWAAWQLWGLPE